MKSRWGKGERCCAIRVGPLNSASQVLDGSDVTVVGWGAQIHVLTEACKKAKEEAGINCDLIDLRTVLPWDVDIVEQSVRKTGRLGV